MSGSERLRRDIAEGKDIAAQAKLSVVARLQREGAPREAVAIAAGDAARASEEALRASLEAGGGGGAEGARRLSPPELIARTRLGVAEAMLRRGEVNERQFEWMRRDIHAWLMDATGEAPAHGANRATNEPGDGGSGTTRVERDPVFQVDADWDAWRRRARRNRA